MNAFASTSSTSSPAIHCYWVILFSFRSFGFATTNSDRFFNPYRDSISCQFFFRFAAPIAMWPSNYLQLASLCRTRRARLGFDLGSKNIEKQWCQFQTFHQHSVVVWKSMLPVFSSATFDRSCTMCMALGALVTPSGAIEKPTVAERDSLHDFSGSDADLERSRACVSFQVHSEHCFNSVSTSWTGPISLYLESRHSDHLQSCMWHLGMPNSKGMRQATLCSVRWDRSSLTLSGAAAFETWSQHVSHGVLATL